MEFRSNRFPLKKMISKCSFIKDEQNCCGGHICGVPHFVSRAHVDVSCGRQLRSVLKTINTSSRQQPQPSRRHIPFKCLSIQISVPSVSCPAAASYLLR